MIAMIFLGIGFLNAVFLRPQDPCACLPKDIKRTDVVTVQQRGPGRSGGKKVTVEQKLKEIKARCRKGKLVDAAGKPIYFYQLQGCWGNPPEGYQEILSAQQRELEKLRKTYRVIEMTCNPSGDVIM
jgi:hypothetical protein